jgi:hypothetical protein
MQGVREVRHLSAEGAAEQDVVAREILAYVSTRQHTSVKGHLGAEVAAEQDVVARQILVHNRIGRLGVEEVHADRDVKEYLDYLQYSFSFFKAS